MTTIIKKPTRVEEVVVGGLYGLDAGGGWCKHGLVIIKNDSGFLRATDTYWGDNPIYSVESILPRLTFILDLNHAKIVDERTFWQYADEDRAYIPVGGGSKRYYIRSDSKPSVERKRIQLESEIRQCEASISREERNMEEKREELRALGDKKT